VEAIEAAREFGFHIVGVMCLVERQEAGGRLTVEKAAAPAPFVSIFTASDVRKEHLLQTDETSPGIPAAGSGCEICGRPAVVHSPRIRCETHRV
jgi:orotate phosphoribosyltransferase